MYYFAYGSNLDIAQMQRRCPGAKRLGSARLFYYGLRFDGAAQNWSMRAAANVVPSVARSVWGALYEVTAEDVRLLDGYEHVPVSYQRLVVRVWSQEVGWCEAMVYLRGPQPINQPSLEYLSAIMKGGIEHGLPVGYLAGVVDRSGLAQPAKP